ncbi:unnamed protein product [Moneuplotes crassus]|uniref:Uncharacterized protein n=1 Tax=Euplotes crassus TaxID=5936 RepID=A0AAD2D590_EUPCR|nr:unnamed protein product [Moneuplotes crassus]
MALKHKRWLEVESPLPLQLKITRKTINKVVCKEALCLPNIGPSQLPCYKSC